MREWTKLTIQGGKRLIEKKKAPKLRFPGFTDDWEQRKLGEISKYSNGGSYENDVVENGTYELITLKSVNMSGKLVSSGKFINRETKTLEKDTLVMILSEQAPGLLGMTAQIPENNKYVLNQRVAEIKPNTNIDSYFLSMSINRSQVYFSKRGAGTKVQNISKPNVENFEFYCPSEREQQKIGSFFKQLDDTIALHQRKLEHTKDLKKSMLQKMFPKKGEKNPEIRFPGFTDDWEQRKLGDVFDERSERASGNEELLSVTISNGVIRQIDSEKRNIASEDKSNYKVVKKGDVPYNSMRMWQGAVGTSDYDGIVSPAYTVLIPKNNCNGKFFMELFKKQPTLEIFKRWSQGLTSDTWNLKYPVLSTIPFMVPSVKEQEKIAEYFKSLDNLITLHQRELEHLKLLKKGLLQQMFV